MADPFLILHKVRGEPAFDIAIQMFAPDESNGADEGDGEVWWIIPTSGHRAYPLFFWSVKNLMIQDEWGTLKIIQEIGPVEAHPGFAPLLDHYPSRTASEPKINLSSIITALSEPVERRF